MYHLIVSLDHSKNPTMYISRQNPDMIQENTFYELPHLCYGVNIDVYQLYILMKYVHNNTHLVLSDLWCNQALLAYNLNWMPFCESKE